jgi:Mrp family chromosome partitioning ATPase
LLDQVLQKVPQLPSLSLIPAGEHDSNAAELFASLRWPEVAKELRQRFQHIVIDCPPHGVVTDLDLVAAVSDGVILVVRPEHTNRKQLNDAMKDLGGKVIGIVLNGCEDWFLWSPDGSYSHYYRGVVPR